jgi:putative chitinase
VFWRRFYIGCRTTWVQTQMVTAELLFSLGVTRALSSAWAPAFQHACDALGVDDLKVVAAILGQVLVESNSFQNLTENLNYTTVGRLCAVYPRSFPSPASAQPFLRNPQGVANRVMAGRFGNGNESSGDGWRFRGRGPIQLTWRANYKESGAQLRLPLEAQPESVLEPKIGALVSVNYLLHRNVTKLAQLNKLKEVTASVNAGLLELPRRVALSNTAAKFLGVNFI